MMSLAYCSTLMFRSCFSNFNHWSTGKPNRLAIRSISRSTSARVIVIRRRQHSCTINCLLIMLSSTSLP